MKIAKFISAIFVCVLFKLMFGSSFLLNLVIILPLFIGTINRENEITCIHISIAKYMKLLYVALFLARFVANRTLQKDSYFGRIVITESNVDQAMLLCSVFTTSFLCGIFFSHSLQQGACKLKLQLDLKDILWLKSYARIGSAVSLCGFFTYFIISSSQTNFALMLKMHNKTLLPASGIGGLGLSIWAILSASSVTLALLYSIITKSYSEFLYTIAIFSIYIFLLGSRLDLFSICLNVYILYTLFSRRSGLVILAYPVSILIPIFFYTLNSRIKNVVDKVGFLDAFTYPILDASQVVITQPKAFFETTLHFNRILELSSNYIPRFFYLDKPSIQNLRLDTIVANSLGTELQRGRTGWPTGAFTELFIIGNFYFLVLASFATGIMVSALFLKIIKNSKNTGPLVVKLLVFFGFLLAWYKDGDFFVTIQGSVRQYIYALIAIFGISKYRQYRDRIK